MHQMAGIGHQSAQGIPDLESPLGKGRHFHQMHIKMQQTGMLHRCLISGKGRFKNLLTFNSIGALCGRARRQIPHFPRRAIEHGFNKNRSHVPFIRKRLKHRPHFGSKVVIPCLHII